MRAKSSTPIVYGTGLIALDVIYGLESEAPRFNAGGTCGNVLVGLSFLGWKSYPISRLADDAAGEIVRTDLARWGVRLDFVGLSPTAPTPIIIEQIVQTKRGVPTHRFHLTCPGCGGWYPSFRPLREDTVTNALSRFKAPSVLFVDRVSKGIVQLATHCARAGALIVFEPCGAGDTKLFKQMLQLAHVVKYSQERAKSFIDILPTATPLLQVETLGEDGLRYLSRLANAKSKGWKKVDAIEISVIKDAAGSGDWSTVGLVDALGRLGLRGFHAAKDSELVSALKYSQAIAAWNCGYEGARGGMYHASRSTLQTFIDSALKKPASAASHTERPSKLVSRALDLCPECKPIKGSVATSVGKREIRNTAGSARTRTVPHTHG